MTGNKMRPFLTHQLFLTQGFMKHRTSIMDAPLHRAQWDAPAFGNLGQRVALGELQQGLHRHRCTAHAADDLQQLVVLSHHVGRCPTLAVLIAHADGVHVLQPAACIDP